MFERIRHTIVFFVGGGGGKTRGTKEVYQKGQYPCTEAFYVRSFFFLLSRKKNKNDITLTSFLNFINAEMFDYYSVLNSSVVDNGDWSCELAVLQCRKTG